MRRLASPGEAFDSRHGVEAPREAGRPFLVIGSGRSGTKYVAFLLRSLGLDIGHESIGTHGTVSWYLASDALTVPYGPASSQVKFSHVFHQVRHPLHSIASMMTLRLETWMFVAKHTGCSLSDPLLLRCARLWLEWNELAERKAEWRYRIEELPAIYEEFCRRFGVVADRQMLHRLPRDINTRPPYLSQWVSRVETRSRLHRSWIGGGVRRLLIVTGRTAAKPLVTWAQLDGIDGHLTRAIRAKALEYGYEC